MKKVQDVYSHEDGSTAGRRLRIPPVFMALGAPGWGIAFREVRQDGFLRPPPGANSTLEEQP